MTESRAVTLVACFGFFAAAAYLSVFVGRSAWEILVTLTVCVLILERVGFFEGVRKARTDASNAIDTVSLVSKGQRVTAAEVRQVRTELNQVHAWLNTLHGWLDSDHETVIEPQSAPQHPQTQPAAEVAATQVEAIMREQPEDEWRARFTFADRGRAA